MFVRYFYTDYLDKQIVPCYNALLKTYYEIIFDCTSFLKQINNS